MNLLFLCFQNSIKETTANGVVRAAEKEKDLKKKKTYEGKKEITKEGGQNQCDAKAGSTHKYPQEQTNMHQKLKRVTSLGPLLKMLRNSCKNN